MVRKLYNILQNDGTQHPIASSGNYLTLDGNNLTDQVSLNLVSYSPNPPNSYYNPSTSTSNVYNNATLK